MNSRKINERETNSFIPFLMNPDYCLITNEDEQIGEKLKYRWILRDRQPPSNVNSPVRWT